MLGAASKSMVLGLNFTQVQFLCPFIHLLPVPMAVAGHPAVQLCSLASLRARSGVRRVAWQDPAGSSPHGQLGAEREQQLEGCGGVGEGAAVPPPRLWRGLVPARRQVPTTSLGHSHPPSSGQRGQSSCQPREAAPGLDTATTVHLQQGLGGNIT